MKIEEARSGLVMRREHEVPKNGSKMGEMVIFAIASTFAAIIKETIVIPYQANRLGLVKSKSLMHRPYIPFT